MGMQRNTIISVRLKGEGDPYVRIGMDDWLMFSCKLVQPQTYGFNHPLDDGEHELWVELDRKTDADGDQHVEIEWVEIEGMRLDRVKWQGVYVPRYPEPWASQQADLPAERPGETHLGWNGRWSLRFTVPVFEWIHGVEHLGWIYR
jgi:hypothetical protein